MNTREDLISNLIYAYPFLEEFAFEQRRCKDGIRFILTQESRSFSYTYIQAIEKAVYNSDLYDTTNTIDKENEDALKDVFINRLFLKVLIEGRHSGIWSQSIISSKGRNTIRKAIAGKKLVQLYISIDLVYFVALTHRLNK